MMDVSKSLKERNTLALANPMTDYEPAKLAGIPGKGIIQVIRTLEGEVLELIGTWRLVEDGDHAIERLGRAYESKESISYQGHFSDPLHPSTGMVTVDVRIVAVRPYQYKQQDDPKVKPKGEPEVSGMTKTLYRLELVGPLPHPDQAARAVG